MEEDNKKILYVINSLDTDGISKIISDFCKNISNKFKIDLCCNKIINKCYLNDCDKKINIYEIERNNTKFKHIVRMIEFFKIVKKENYDIVHINGNYIIKIEECIIAKIAGVKHIIIHSHNSNAGDIQKKCKIKMYIHNSLKWLFNIFATDFFACSEEAGRWMFTKKICESKLKIIKNGIESEKYQFNEVIRNKYRKQLNIENKFVIGHIGRFAYQKNHEFLIKVFEKLLKKNPQSVLLLIGNGELENRVKNIVNNNENLKNNVIFLEVRDDIENLLQAMDVFVFPSVYEGLGIVNIEAQAAALHVIASNKVPKEVEITEYIEFLTLDDTEEWANCILKYKDGYERKNMHDIIKENGFDIRNSVNDMEEYYLKFIK